MNRRSSRTEETVTPNGFRSTEWSLVLAQADCAMVITLPPGPSHTAEVTGVAGTTGVALVEVYQIVP